MPALADPAALQHDVVDTLRCEAPAHDEAGLGAANDDDIGF
jgi:hypothetical protein